MSDTKARLVGSPKHVALWTAIREWSKYSGAYSPQREEAVVRVEAALQAIIDEQTATSAQRIVSCPECARLRERVEAAIKALDRSRGYRPGLAEDILRGEEARANAEKA